MFIFSMNHLLLTLSNIINPGNLLLDMSARTLIISCTNSIMFYFLDSPVFKIRQPSMYILSFLLFGQNLLMLSERCISFQTTRHRTRPFQRLCRQIAGGQRAALGASKGLSLKLRSGAIDSAPGLCQRFYSQNTQPDRKSVV